MIKRNLKTTRRLKRIKGERRLSCLEGRTLLGASNQGEADPPELEAAEFLLEEAFPSEDEGVGE